MSHTIKTVIVLGTLLSLLWLSACSPAAPTGTPTAFDLDPFRTEVASTVLAQVSQTLAAAPSNTPVPSPTATIPPMPTLAPTGASTLPPGAFPVPEGTSTTGTPTATGGNLAKWVSQTIPDGMVFEPGEAFTVTFRMRNVGIAPWTAAYWVRSYTGSTYGAPKEFQLGRDVPPGQEVDIPLAMKAPTNPGDYRSDWVLSDASRSNFKEPIFFKFSVANPATATPRPTATPAATRTASATP